MTEFHPLAKQNGSVCKSEFVQTQNNWYLVGDPNGVSGQENVTPVHQAGTDRNEYERNWPSNLGTSRALKTRLLMLID